MPSSARCTNLCWVDPSCSQDKRTSVVLTYFLQGTAGVLSFCLSMPSTARRTTLPQSISLAIKTGACHGNDDVPARVELVCSLPPFTCTQHPIAALSQYLNLLQEEQSHFSELMKPAIQVEACITRLHFCRAIREVCPINMCTKAACHVSVKHWGLLCKDVH